MGMEPTARLEIHFPQFDQIGILALNSHQSHRGFAAVLAEASGFPAMRLAFLEALPRTAKPRDVLRAEKFDNKTRSCRIATQIRNYVVEVSRGIKLSVCRAPLNPIANSKSA